MQDAVPQDQVRIGARLVVELLRINAEGNVEMLEPALPEGRYKYAAGGVVGQDGCIYFAPGGAGKVLRVST